MHTSLQKMTLSAGKTLTACALIFFSTVFPLVSLVQPAYADYTATWWNGHSCDSVNDPGSTQIGIWNGLQSCIGPTSNPNPDINDNFAGKTTLEWECVDLVLRYLYLAFGVTPYAANGAAIVDNYQTAYGGNLTPLNPSSSAPPVTGDVVSFNGVTGNPAGHTAVVLSSSVDTNGNGPITFLQQNASPLPAQWSITLSNWNTPANSGVGSVKNWLHSGPATSQPYRVAAQRNSGDGHLELFKRGADGNAWHDYYSSTGWSGMQQLSSSPQLQGNIFAILNAGSSGNIELFARDTNGVVNHNYQTSTGWSGWSSLGGTLVSDVAASLNGGGGPELFGIGTNGNIWHDYRDASGGWNNWGTIGSAPSGGFTGTPFVLLEGTTSQYLEVFARDTSANLWHNYYTANGWSGWGQLPSPSGVTITGDIDASVNPSGAPELFAVASDGNIWHDYLNTQTGSWNNWGPLSSKPSGATFTGRPFALIDHPEGIEVFARDTNGQSYHQWFSSNAWSGWYSMPGATLNGDIAAALNPSGSPEIFARGTDGTIWHNYVNWNNWGSMGSGG